MNKKALIVALALVVGGFIGVFFTYFWGASGKNSYDAFMQSMFNITKKESVTEKQLKAILKSYDEKDWNTFNKKVDIGLIVKNGVEEAVSDTKKKKKITQDEKMALEIIEGWIPLVIEHTKNEFYNYFMKGINSSNSIVKIFSLKPEMIFSEKDENNFKILPVSYVADNKKEILVHYKFILENDEWKLIDIRGNEDLAEAMGWEHDEDEDYNKTYVKKHKKKYSYYDNSSYSDEGAIKRYANEQNNAYETAMEYAYDGSGMSKQGVYEQLLYEGFSEKDSKKAVEKLTGVDWKGNAFEAALNYQTDQYMSKKAIKEQLLFEGFTIEEAEYAVNKLH